MTHIISIIAQKGGVGKTTITIELASGLSQLGYSVLIIDNDPQGSASRRISSSNIDHHYTLNDVYTWAVKELGVINDAIYKSRWELIDYVISELALKNRENDGGIEADFRLQRAIENSPIDYDFILIDNAPAGGLLVKNSLIASNYALIVTEPEIDGIRGAGDAIENIGLLKRRLNPNLFLLGIVVNKYQKNTLEHKYRIEELYKLFPNDILSPFISHRTIVAQSSGMAIPTVELKNSTSQEFNSNILELIKNLKNKIN